MLSRSIYILFLTSTHQFTNPRIFHQNINLLSVFSGLKSSNLFLNLERLQNAFHRIIKIIITPNLLKNIHGLVEINWWIDITDKIKLPYFAINLLNLRFSTPINFCWIMSGKVYQKQNCSKRELCCSLSVLVCPNSLWTKTNTNAHAKLIS